SQGDLKSYLRSCRDSMTFDPLVLQRMACEISSGLLHLHKHNFIHSDLALRNCLLTSDITEDYLVTPDQLWIPLRWIGPELVDEVHGNLLVVDQTKPSNIWSLGVTIWELFELGSQPYRHYSDRQVLIYVVKEQQLKLSKPLLDLPLSDRWYEVMQFCWLQPEQRPNAEEVHLLLSYLCAKGASEAEDDFEKRWNSLRPNGSLAPAAAPAPLPPPPSPFPLLQHLPAPEPGDDILTVTETSHGLNFEYQWEQAQHDPSCSQAPHSGFQDVYYPPGPAGLSLGVSPSYYEPPKPLPVAGPVPSLGGDYYSRLDGRGLDCPVCPYSPEYQGSSSSASFLTGSGDSGECLGCPAPSFPHHHSYWPSHIRKASTYDWDGSPTFSLTMEPLLGEDPCGSSHTCSPAHTCSPTHSCSPAHGWETGHYVSYKHRDGGYYYEPPPEHYLVGGLAGISEPAQESWGSRSLRQALGELENPLGLSPSLSSPDQDYSAPYLQGKSTAVVGSGGYWDMLGPLRSTMPRPHSLSIAPEPGGALLHVQHPLYTPTPTGWASNCSANNNSLSSQQQPGGGSGARHFHYTLPSAHSRGPSLRYPESRTLGGHSHTLPTPASRDSGSCIYLHPKDMPPSPCLHKEEGCPFVDPLSGATVQIYTTSHHHHLREKSSPPLAREGTVLSGGLEKSGEEGPLHPGAPGEPISASGLGGDSGVGRGSSIISLVDINDCSDDDITDVTSGVFADSPLDCDSLGGSIPALEKQQETPAATELSPSPTAMNPPSPTPMHPPSPTPSQPPSPPKALDSGYDTENNESPEFVLKEPQELAPPSGKQSPSGDPHEDANDPPSTEPGLTSLSQNTPYRDSAYFSDYDADSEGRGFSDKQDEENPEVATHTERLRPPQAVLGDSASSSPDSQSYQVYQHIGVESSSECSTPSTCSVQEALCTAGEESLHKSPAADPAPGSSTAMMDKAEREVQEAELQGAGPQEVEIVREEVHEVELKEVEIVREEVQGEEVQEVEIVREEVHEVELKEVEIVREEVQGEEVQEVEIVREEVQGEEVQEVEILREEVQGEEVQEVEIVREEVQGEEVQEVEIVREEVHEVELKEVEIVREEVQGEEVQEVEIVREEVQGEGVQEVEIVREEVHEVELKEVEIVREEVQGEGVQGVEIVREGIVEIEKEVENFQQKVVAEEGKLEVDEDGQEFKMKIEEEEIMENVELEKKEEVECNIEVEMDTSLGELLEEVPVSKGGREGAQSSAPLSLLGGRVSPGDGEEGDSEDSEESDEELHSYSLQEEEQSEEVQNEQCEELHSCSLQEEEQSEELQKEQCEELHSCSLQEEKQSEELQKEQHEELHSYKLQEEQRGEHHKEQCEELHRFSMHDEQQSEEEEEEESNQAVPIVVCDSSHALHLRSLLKMPALLTNPPCNTEHACRRKAVSFFDDVTVYLFDQESPTRELAEHSFPVGPEPGGQGFSPGAQSSGQGSEGVTPPLQERVSDDSSDGNLSEESGGFEWEDDFHLLSSPSLMMSSTSDTLEALEAKPSPRFSISRFSITHVTDSDMDSAGGSSEDGERE
ncbi:hypothetical protein JZ751_019183, partial [Albula glossodonta]